MKTDMKRGDVYYVDLNPSIGHEQCKVRPCVIVQNDIGNRNSCTTIVAPITSQEKPIISTHVRVCKKDKLHYKSIILLEQIRTIDKQRLQSFMCTLSDETMRKVDEALKISLDLKEKGGDTMKEIIEVNNQILTVKEYEGSRVVTFKDIDMVHERPEGTARKRFNDNKNHFIEDVDYFSIPFNDHPENGQSIFEMAATMEADVGIDYSGFIYIAIDPNNGLIKIGRTTNKAKRRISSLNVGRTDKIVEYEYYACKDVLKAEKNIHKILSYARRTGEWFDLDISEAREIIKEETNKVDENYDPTKRHRGGCRANTVLITESGYLMLVKSFTDDLAWDVQRKLVNSYFNKKKPLTTQEMVRIQLGMIDEHEERISNLENMMNVDYKQQRVLEKEVSSTVINALGGKDSVAYSEMSKKVFAECNRDVKHYFNVNSRCNIPRLKFDKAVEYIRGWVPCTNTRVAIESCNDQTSLGV